MVALSIVIIFTNSRKLTSFSNISKIYISKNNIVNLDWLHLSSKKEEDLVHVCYDKSKKALLVLNHAGYDTFGSVGFEKIQLRDERAWDLKNIGW